LIRDKIFHRKILEFNEYLAVLEFQYSFYEMPYGPGYDFDPLKVGIRSIERLPRRQAGWPLPLAGELPVLTKTSA
jgi:hypothetical protein